VAENCHVTPFHHYYGPHISFLRGVITLAINIFNSYEIHILKSIIDRTKVPLTTFSEYGKYLQGQKKERYRYHLGQGNNLQKVAPSHVAFHI